MNRSEAGKLGYEKTKHILQEQGQQRTQKTIDEYDANPKFCLFCGTKLSFEKRRGKFCNHSCSAQHNNRGVTRHIKGSKVCQCGQPKKSHNSYCADCIEKRVYNRIASFEEAQSDSTRRKYLLEHRGYRCERCRLEEWMGEPIPLELDHINGDTDNNSAENLRLLCPNCHAQTETYKGANKGKSGKRQQMRRKRYADGLTW